MKIALKSKQLVEEEVEPGADPETHINDETLTNSNSNYTSPFPNRTFRAKTKPYMRENITFDEPETEYSYAFNETIKADLAHQMMVDTRKTFKTSIVEHTKAVRKD